MPRPNRALEQMVIRRAANRCEYCRLPQAPSELEFHCDHIIAEKHGGATEEDNLAWACFSCNLRKGSNLSGLDPAAGKLTRLFHPRTDRWEEHFAWEGAQLRGKTAIGRTTIVVLDINHPDTVALREALSDENIEF